MVTGKGGTGRSAVAAALAIALARRGARTLALAFDAGDGLADHLGAPPLDTVPRPTHDVWAARVDPAVALDEYLRLRIAIPRVAGAGRVFAAVAETVPGVRDTVMIGKVLHEATSGNWDAVVVDGPPTGQVVSYLRAPRTIASLVPGGAVRRQALSMESVLADPGHAGLVIVATPEELPVIEATELRAFASSDGSIGVAAIVANRVLAPAGFSGEEAATARGPRGDAGRHHLAALARQETHLGALGATVALPMLFGIHRADEVAARLSVHWEESWGG